MRRYGLFLWVLATGLGGCDSNERAAVDVQSDQQAASTTLNTFITQFLQIDQQNVGTTDPADANLFLGNDPPPGDGSASYFQPVPMAANPVWIDWNDLGTDLGNHRITDPDGAKGKDPTSFPQSNECVAASQVLSKMNLTYVASANNTEFAYFAVQRADNNGDAGYYWLFTKKPPNQVLGEAPCSADQTRLTYDISGPAQNDMGATTSSGDVLLAGHFKPSSTPLLRVFHATQDATHVTAVDAVDFTSSLWAEDTTAIAAAAVNTTNAAPGAFGSAGVLALSKPGGALLPEIFAEAAVKISAFTQNACGATFYGSVITRSSGSGGTSPDLKDLAGPALFNFGSVTGTASVTPGCDGLVNFTASGTGIDGQPVTKCTWVFDNKPNDPAFVKNVCTGSITLSPGTHSAVVTIGDAGCTDTKSFPSITAFSAVSAQASMNGNCSNQLSYSASGSGGSGNYTYLWSFTPSTPNGADLNAASKSLSNVAAGSYAGTVTVTDSHDGVTCSATANASATVYSPITVNLSALAPTSCTTDAAVFNLSVQSGSGSHTTMWSGCTSMTDQCTVNPADDTYCAMIPVSATVTDPQCGSKASNTLNYSKITSVTVQ